MNFVWKCQNRWWHSPTGSRAVFFYQLPAGWTAVCRPNNTLSWQFWTCCHQVEGLVSFLQTMGDLGKVWAPTWTNVQHFASFQSEYWKTICSGVVEMASSHLLKKTGSNIFSLACIFNNVKMVNLSPASAGGGGWCPPPEFSEMVIKPLGRSCWNFAWLMGHSFCNF